MDKSEKSRHNFGKHVRESFSVIASLITIGLKTETINSCKSKNMLILTAVTILYLLSFNSSGGVEVTMHGQIALASW